ncbi:phosphoglycerate mutase (2,3-diphosphoglycerate-independent) [Candidatus Berkelbacteria bacterium RBG_13_40_8]|uniref:2,3-bisphosphoglycerate-independent phosphoglycerate mutase n=1 Tax=Candidatus Berkelbacteria bacterium RBG_13_40_8 TaxID=1797467 RepID=A0A1F5DQK0_9BACT|nr:MAG: phosphoglycerate mutase (2,3-diphosphoglycerate-independent) [Candidatus Berkelbacteria bacterium RBG_13_40_8]
MIKNTILIILDGWGIAPAWGGNAVEMAETPNFDSLWKKYPHLALQASQEAVGLPRHEPGNSEVGHLNIGSGQIVYQNLPGITATINDGSFFKNEILLGAMENVKKNGSNLHLLGLTSDGGVHAHIAHLFALLDLAKKQDVNKVYIHMITDGRDTSPMKALTYIEALEKKIKEVGVGKISSIMGRYWAMDRDKHYDRTQKAYEVLTQGIGAVSDSAERAISENYRQNRTDEFIAPTAIQKQAEPFTPISNNDSVIFFNYRAERARQLTEAFTDKDFNKFDRRKVPQNLYFATFAFLEEYTENPAIKTVFYRREINQPLGKAIADAGKKQIHIAETEKYAHVTFFFDGSKQKPFPGEEQVLISSPKVTTFDLKPEMSAEGVAKKVIESFPYFDFTVCNFANADMVGHTGNIKATIRACEKVDECLGRIVKAGLEKNAVIMITADHGNAEQMLEPNTGEAYTEHTMNPVPFIICSNEPNFQRPLRVDGGEHGLILSDIAPTILEIMGIQKPQEMTGTSLLQK